MTAKIYTLPGGERNPQLVHQRRQALLARPDIQAKFAELSAALLDYHAMRGLCVQPIVKQDDKSA